MTDTSGGYGGTAASYPATFTFDPPERVANWRWFGPRLDCP